METTGHETEVELANATHHDKVLRVPDVKHAKIAVLNKLFDSIKGRDGQY